MKSFALAGLMTVAAWSSSQAQSLQVSTPMSCRVSLINTKDIQSDQAYGWWDVWKDRKKDNKDVFDTPYTFKKMPAGTYVLVVFNPSADETGAESDGIILESINITKKSKLVYDFKADDFVEWNCLSCPWLYVAKGSEYVRLTEVIQDVVGKENCQTTVHTIDPQYLSADGKLKFRIQEEKDETSFLDQVTLTVDGKKVQGKVTDSALLDAHDQQYLVLRKGEAVEIEFDLSKIATPDSKIVLECNGYYEPDRAYLEAVYQKYLYKRGS